MEALLELWPRNIDPALLDSRNSTQSVEVLPWSQATEQSTVNWAELPDPFPPLAITHPQTPSESSRPLSCDSSTGFLNSFSSCISARSKRQKREKDLYSCEECARRFDTASELRKHRERTHVSAEDRPHKCSMCNKRFCWPKDVRRHEQSVHKKVDGTQTEKSGSDVSESRKRPASPLANLSQHPLDALGEKVNEFEVQSAGKLYSLRRQLAKLVGKHFGLRTKFLSFTESKIGLTVALKI